MDRRTFLNWVGLGAIATSLPMALAACGSGDQSTSPESAAPESAAPEATAPEAAASPASSAAEGFVAVGSVSALDNGAAISDSKFAGGSGKLIVFKDGENIVALDANCNHANCAVNLEGSELVCPCHASKFATDGTLISGPATEGLAPFEVKVEGDQVLVKTS